MKITCILILTFAIFYGDPIQMLQGKWKLESFGAFSAVLDSKNFTSGTEEEKAKLIEVMDFALNNTFYEFKGDTIFITEGVIDKVEKREVIFTINDDKMSIFYLDQIKTTDYRLIEVSDSKLVLDMVYNRNSNSDMSAVFRKIDP